MFLDIDKKPFDSIALIDSDGDEASYGDIVDFSQEFGDIIAKRSLVFIKCRNCVGSVIGFLASISDQIVPLLLDDSMDDGLFNRLIEVYHPQYIWKPDMALDNSEEVVFSKYGYALVRTGYQSYPLYDGLSLLLSTSGSTGSPKLVRHSYVNLDSQGKNISAFFAAREDDKAIADLPMHYTMGLSVIISFLYAGATVLLTGLTVLDTEYWEYIKSNQASVFTNIPYTYEILSKLRFFRMDLPHLRILSQGGGKLREELFVQCVDYANKNGKQFIATYGQTEGTARMAYLPSEYAGDKVCSIGKAIPGGKLYLIDENDSVITRQDQEGELVYEGPNVTLGYAESAEDLLKGDERKGILRTGDIAKMDEDGFFYITGRKSRFLKLTGHRVSLDECEKLVTARFGNQCACTGDDTKLCVHICGEFDQNEVIDYISSVTKMNTCMICVMELDKIPRSSTGKVLYSQL